MRWNRQQLAWLAIELGCLLPLSCFCCTLHTAFQIIIIITIIIIIIILIKIIIMKPAVSQARHRAGPACCLLPLSCFCCQLTPCYCTLHTAFQMLPLPVFIGSTNTLKNQMVKSYCCFSGKLDCRWKKVDSVLSACNAVLSHPEN